MWAVSHDTYSCQTKSRWIKYMGQLGQKGGGVGGSDDYQFSAVRLEENQGKWIPIFHKPSGSWKRRRIADNVWLIDIQK